MLTQAGAMLASQIPKLIGARDLARSKPFTKSGRYAERKLAKGFDKHVDDIKPGRKVDIDVAENYPPSTDFGTNYQHVLSNSNRYASSTLAGEQPGVAINPNADRVYYAHELGHIASQQSDIGHFVNQLRQNPQLARAMGISMMTVPALAAIMEEGDNDLDSSIALAALTSAPVIADEALASYHGQRIMDKAGLRTSMGQRGKLAGGLLSYLAAPIIAGTAGNVVGNMLD